MTPNLYSHRAIRSLARLVGVMSSLLLALLLLGANPLLALTHAAPASHIWASATGTATLTIATATRPADATGFPFAILAARWGSEGSGDGQFNLAAGPRRKKKSPPLTHGWGQPCVSDGLSEFLIPNS